MRHFMREVTFIMRQAFTFRKLSIVVKIVLFYSAWIVLLPSVMWLFTIIKTLVEDGYESGYGFQGESGDLDMLIHIVKKGFNTLITIGVVIICLLTITGFRKNLIEELQADLEKTEREYLKSKKENYD
jgi:hypothetical protein